jgi:integrase
MHELDGRDLFKFRVWRKEGGYSEGQDEHIAPKTLETALVAVRSLLRTCVEIEAVHEDLYTKVPIPDVPAADEVSDSKIAPERIPPILEYLERYEYASRDHVQLLLMWHCGARTGGLRALDLRDLELEGTDPIVRFKHRPDTGTPLKNDLLSERANRISEEVAITLQDYIDGPRNEVVEESGRRPLLTARGRLTATPIREATYRWTQPCAIGEECPHDRDPETCEWTARNQSSKCPSSRSPHDFRKARVTKYRNDDVPRGIVSDRLDASEKVLDKHYDRASQRKRAERRWNQIKRSR